MKRTEGEFKIISEKAGDRRYYYIAISTPAGHRFVTGALHSLKEAQIKLEVMRKNEK